MQPTFTGCGVGVGLTSYVMSKDKVIEYFNILNKTFDEYSKELREEYLKSKQGSDIN